MTENKILLSIRGLTYFVGERRLLDIPQLRITETDHIGIVGENGCGKSTLLDLMAGVRQPESGSIKRYCPLAYCRQLAAADLSAADGPLAALGAGVLAKQPGRSGGEETRVKLAAALEERAPLLLCDEPTANLDESGQKEICQRLAEVETLVLVSHDRALLNALCRTIWEVRGGELHIYPGDYDCYRRQKDLEAETARQKWTAYSEERARLQAAASQASHQAGKVKKAPSRMGNSEARLHRREATQKSAKIARRKKVLESRLARMEEVEKPREDDSIALHIDPEPLRARTALSASGLTAGYTAGRAIISDATFTLPTGSKTALIGPNGAGKTTLLRVLAGELSPIGGSYRLSPQARLGFLRQGFEQLDERRTILENALDGACQSPTLVRTVLGRLFFRREEVNKPLGVLSGGERMKVALCKLLVGGCNLLFLDEPTNYLDLPAVEALQGLLQSYTGTLLLVSHDEAFLEAVADRLLLMDGGEVRAFAGGLRDWHRQRELPLKKAARDATLQRTVLEMRLSQLAVEISAAPAPEKEALEQAYQNTVAELRRLREL
ncbi:ABC-F family ATP-binding cassette domain-containing protein [Neobittarella massiliensis]|uniref:ABC-F family ATP-binding cassette domain-containing protein n=1 Tax=Neobittarella massiliensis (ex Bilen et al. 2018) TaxID=2041842 RepID=A0A8J6LYI6_9FIRM|nr:ABC-F family ATP-binding cassette domain-containing protein [Neobittarella massiliensis]MBC3515597.1 ABC-F family ATP-binding cassette domain-containing protein [Neobittarella massiliensis]